MKKLIGMMLAVCMIVPLAAGCGKKEEPQPSAAAPTQSAVSTGRDPLNGSETISEYKPIIAMIDNSDAARPQEGIQAADIMYECEVEGGITRLMGVWNSDVPDVIGPVRSARPVSYTHLTAASMAAAADLPKWDGGSIRQRARAHRFQSLA